MSDAGAVKGQSVSLTTKELSEQVLPKARISGSLLTGVQRTGDAAGPVGLEADLPADWAGATVCVRVTSIDGLYISRNLYQIAPDWAGGTAALNYPSKYVDVLIPRMDDGAMGVRVTRAPCDAPEGEMALASWRGAAGPPAILVNSFQADAVYAYLDDATVPVRCERLDLPGLSAYDTRCPLGGGADGDPSGGTVELRILRIVDGKTAPQEAVTLRLSGE